MPKSNRVWAGAAGLLTMALAGCGATTSVATRIHANGSGSITWTVSDTASDIQQNGNLTVPQVTTLLRHHAPTGAAVTGPVVQNGNEVWTIRASFRSIHQLNAILRSAMGSYFQPASLHPQGVPWATTYVVNDPASGSGHQWHWVTKALAASNNSQSSDWQSSRSNDTLTLPWAVPPGQPSFTEASQTLSQSAETLFGVYWVKPAYHLTLTPHLTNRPTLQGTWAMRFTARQWRQMSPATQKAITAWWHHADAKGTVTHHAGSVTWKVPITLKPGRNAPWGTLAFSAASPQESFWHQRHVLHFTFAPSAAWLLPANWSNAGLEAQHGWNGTLTIVSAQWATPFAATLNTHHAALSQADWTDSASWTTWRWPHVVEVGSGAVVVFAGAMVGGLAARRRQRLLVTCAQCHRKNSPEARFCTRCGASLEGTHVS